MSEERLQELKRKHRSEENRAMVKADMDYLKDMIKHCLDKGGGIPGLNTGSCSTMSFSAMPNELSAAVSMPGAASSGGGTVDIRV